MPGFLDLGRNGQGLVAIDRIASIAVAEAGAKDGRTFDVMMKDGKVLGSSLSSVEMIAGLKSNSTEKPVGRTEGGVPNLPGFIDLGRMGKGLVAIDQIASMTQVGGSLDGSGRTFDVVLKDGRILESSVSSEDMVAMLKANSTSPTSMKLDGRLPNLPGFVDLGARSRSLVAIDQIASISKTLASAGSHPDVFDIKLKNGAVFKSDVSSSDMSKMLKANQLGQKTHAARRGGDEER